MGLLNKPPGALVPKILTSKKGQAMIVGLVVTLFAQKLGIDLNAERLAAVVALLVGFMASQGVADIGKERVKAENGNLK